MTIVELLDHVIAEYERVAGKAKAVIPSLKDWLRQNSKHASFSAVSIAANVIFAHAVAAQIQYKALKDQKKERSKSKVQLPAEVEKAERKAYMNKLDELATLEAAVDKINTSIK